MLVKGVEDDMLGTVATGFDICYLAELSWPLRDCRKLLLR